MSEVFVRHFFMNNRKAEMIQKQIQEMLDHQSIIRTSDVVKNGQLIKIARRIYITDWSQ
ncbi:Uncharacterised protein [Streptococcus parasanguinis]|nr:Uncharacterised protein [Streptococcus parasanguinis]